MSNEPTKKPANKLNENPLYMKDSHPTDALNAVANILAFLTELKCQKADCVPRFSPEGIEGLNFTLLTLEQTIRQALKGLEKEDS